MTLPCNLSLILQLAFFDKAFGVVSPAGGNSGRSTFDPYMDQVTVVFTAFDSGILVVVNGIANDRRCLKKSTCEATREESGSCWTATSRRWSVNVGQLRRQRVLVHKCYGAENVSVEFAAKFELSHDGIQLLCSRRRGTSSPVDERGSIEICDTCKKGLQLVVSTTSRDVRLAS